MKNFIKNIFVTTDCNNEINIRYWVFVAIILASMAICYFFSGFILNLFNIKNEYFISYDQYTDTESKGSTQGEIGAIIWIVIAYLVYKRYERNEK